MKNYLMMLIILLSLIIFSFYRLPQAFFQQDEWATFGLIAIFEKSPSQAINILLPRNLLDHFILVTFFVDYLQHHFFGLQFPYYALFSLAFHLLNSILVCYLFFILSGERKLSFLAGLIFSVNSLSHQAVSWISASTSTQGATLFGLMSLIFFGRYLKSGEKRLSLLLFSLVSFLISINFKENSIFLFLFLPSFWFLFTGKRRIINLKKILVSLLIVFFLYLSLRGLIIISGIPPAPGLHLTEKHQSVPITSLFFRAGIHFFRVLPQSLFSTDFLIKLSQSFVFWNYPFFVAPDGSANPYLVESLGFDLVCFFLSAIILSLFFPLLRYFQRAKNETDKRLLIFSLSFVIAGGLPFILIPGPAGFASIFESRNLYLLGIGSSLFLALIILAVSRRSLTLAIIFLISTFFFHIANIRRDLKDLEKTSKVRKEILTEISTLYPHLPGKAIFFTESDTAFYGLPNEVKIMPFQSGFGQTLLIWYHHYGNEFPLCMFTNQYEWLFQIEDQGYQDCQGRGFGYFRQLDLLQTAVQKNRLAAENVFAFRFTAENKKLEDISQLIRNQLKYEP